MKVVRGNSGFGGSSLERGGAVSRRDSLKAVRLLVQAEITFPPREIVSVEPWGFLVPGEAVEADHAAHAEMDALNIPLLSVFTLHFEIDGGERHELSQTKFGPEAVVTAVIPNAWMRVAIGRRVALYYTVELAGGTLLPGPGIEFKVLSPLEIAPIQIEGADYGEPLDPANFPDGVKMTVDRIRNLEDFHDPVLRVMISGMKDGFISTIFSIRYPLDTIQDGPQTVSMGTWALTYPYEEGYTDASVLFALEAQMLPPPNTAAWLFYFVMGQNDILPPTMR